MGGNWRVILVLVVFNLYGVIINNVQNRGYNFRRLRFEGKDVVIEYKDKLIEKIGECYKLNYNVFYMY